MGRIEHPLFDRGRSSTPSHLRPSPAPPPYHTKVTGVSIYDKGPEPRRTPALVESLGYAHNVLLVSGAGVAHEVVGPDPRCCPSQALRAERHHNEPPRRQRRRVNNADAFKHLHVGLGIIEVSPREPIRPLRRREHGDALLAVFILDIVEAPAPRLPICLAPHADDVEMFFGLHAPPPHNRGPGHPEGYPGPSPSYFSIGCTYRLPSTSRTSAPISYSLSTRSFANSAAIISRASSSRALRVCSSI